MAIHLCEVCHEPMKGFLSFTSPKEYGEKIYTATFCLECDDPDSIEEWLEEQAQ